MKTVEWNCAKCSAINPESKAKCWNCSESIEVSREIESGHITKEVLKQQRDQAAEQAALQALNEISAIPVVSIDPLSSIPVGKFRIKGIVSAQTIKSTGTMFGLSGLDGPLDAIDIYIASTKRTTAGEREVIDTLRARAHQIGGNAVIGVDLDFSDSGGLKSVMICAQGTAVFIEDIEQYFDINSH